MSNIATELRRILEMLDNVVDIEREPFAMALVEAAADGVEIMKGHVAQTIKESNSGGEKSAGDLERSIRSVIYDVSGVTGGRMDGKIEIGSDEPHAGYASITVAEGIVNGPVKIEPPGKWVWIDTRPPVPGHPFLERTIGDMDILFATKFSDMFTRVVRRMYREGGWK